MRLLLDTHIFLWALADSRRLSVRAVEHLQDPGNECWVSSASVWEIAIKAALGRHRLSAPLDELEALMDEAGFRSLAVTTRHALAVTRVRTPHADPFDRLLLAQCQVETLQLLTADRALAGLAGVMDAG